MTDDGKRRLKAAADEHRRREHLSHLGTAVRLASSEELQEIGRIAEGDWRCADVPLDLADAYDLVHELLNRHGDVVVVLAGPLGLAAASRDVRTVLPTALDYVVGASLGSVVHLASVAEDALITLGTDERGQELVRGVRRSDRGSECVAVAAGKLEWVPPPSRTDLPYFSAGDPDFWPPRED